MDPEAYITLADGTEAPNPNYTPKWLFHPLGRIVGSTALVKCEIEAAERGELDPNDFTGAEEFADAA